MEDEPAGVDAFEDSAGDISLSAEHLEAPDVRRSPSRATRRRRVLLILGSAVLGFLLLGAIPSLRILWDASLLAFGVTAAYLALLIHFHRRAAERAMKVVEMPERRREARGRRGSVHLPLPRTTQAPGRRSPVRERPPRRFLRSRVRREHGRRPLTALVSWAALCAARWTASRVAGRLR